MGDRLGRWRIEIDRMLNRTYRENDCGTGVADRTASGTPIGVIDPRVADCAAPDVNGGDHPVFQPFDGGLRGTLPPVGTVPSLRKDLGLPTAPLTQPRVQHETPPIH